MPLLVAYGVGAEAATFTDPNVSLFKARQFGEVLAAGLAQRGRVRVEGDRQIDRLRALDRDGYLQGSVGDAFHQLRTAGNEAVHNNLADPQAAFRAVQTCFRLGVWFHRLLTGSRETLPFVPPQPPEHSGPLADDDEALQTEITVAKDALAEARLSYTNGISHAEAERAARVAAERELAEAKAQQDRLAQIVETMRGKLEVLRSEFDRAVTSPRNDPASTGERERLLSNAEVASREPLTEAQVRKKIDDMLRAAGWSVQDYGPQLNLYVEGDFRGNGVAAREVTMAAGRADYLLYVDQRLVGVIEAKREGADLSAAEGQADRYAQSLNAGQRLAAWRPELPFRYASDGGETRFRNTLDPDSRTRRVFSFHQPRTLSRWMRQADEDPDAPTYRARVRLRLPELDTTKLRPAQIDAVRGVERSLSENRGQSGLGQSRSLVQMATGAGKTFTAVTFSYRLLKHARAERVLFLVDRNNLGVQARAEFENYATPGSGRKFTDLYNVQRLDADGMAPSSKVVVSTIQRLYMSLTGQTLPDVAESDDPEADPYDLPGDITVGYNPNIPPESFDLVIVDECHRSIYGKWRSVLEYFDAPIVGLTATPVAQTFGYFNGNLVSEYTYAEAVADAVNVDFRVYRIETEITGKGGVIAKGVIPVRDRRTRRQRYEDIDEDFAYGANDVGTRVITKDQLRTVIHTFHDKLFTGIFPERGKRDDNGRLLREEIYVPKTLVFAKNDNHAEEIVEVIRDIFGKGNEFCAKITHQAKKPAELLSAFRNLPQLRIAVTVDMIATGTDVKALECLLFLRDVRSWAYFEQMKGRGARTLPLTEFERVTPGVGPKTHFVIVDAVGVTEKPKVDAAPLERHTEKQISLQRLLQKAAARSIEDEEVSTLASRLAKLDIQLTDPERAEVEREAGEPLRDIVHRMVDAVSVDGQEAVREQGGDAAVRQLVEAALRPLAENPQLRSKLLEIRRAKDILYDETSKDRLIHAGAVVENAQAVLTSWREYIREHRDEIAIFSAAYSEPCVTPRQAYERLQDVARSLARPPRSWTPDGLWQAYEEIGEAVQEPGAKRGVADLVALIRYELNGGAESGQQARPHASLVEERFVGWLERQRQAGAQFSEEQLWWLRRIADATAVRVRFDAADLEFPPFSARNGVDGFLAAFGEERADEILDELDRELSA